MGEKIATQKYHYDNTEPKWEVLPLFYSRKLLIFLIHKQKGLKSFLWKHNKVWFGALLSDVAFNQPLEIWSWILFYEPFSEV